MAGSKISTRLVAANTMIPVFTSNPSISTSIWFRVCSRSSWEPPTPAPRLRATASISSMNTIHGAFFLASANISRTREAPTPTNISTKSDPEMEKNGTPASPAIALAKSVLPVPGGPTKSIPFGILAPIRVYLSGSFRKSTTSSICCFSSWRPATSTKRTFDSSGLVILARLLPKFAIRSPPPACMAARFCAFISTMKSTKKAPITRIIGRMLLIQPFLGTSDTV